MPLTAIMPSSVMLAQEWCLAASTLACGNSTTAADQVLAYMRALNITTAKLLRVGSAGTRLSSVLRFLSSMMLDSTSPCQQTSGNCRPTVDNKTVFSKYIKLALAGNLVHGRAWSGTATTGKDLLSSSLPALDSRNSGVMGRFHRRRAYLSSICRSRIACQAGIADIEISLL